MKKIFLFSLIISSVYLVINLIYQVLYYFTPLRYSISHMGDFMILLNPFLIFCIDGHCRDFNKLIIPDISASLTVFLIVFILGLIVYFTKKLLK